MAEASGYSSKISAASALDIFFIGNDFGTQRGPVMSPVSSGVSCFPTSSGWPDWGTPTD